LSRAERLTTLRSALRFRPYRKPEAPPAAQQNGGGPTAAPVAKAPANAGVEDVELAIQRDRLLEKFTIMQADLGGAFYEMATRDHVRLDVLTRKAAELQRVDAELGALERRLGLQRTGAVGTCSRCHSPYGPGEVFCSQCGQPLTSSEAR
jgi:hypothetical protein